MNSNSPTIAYNFKDPTLETLAYTHPSCDAAYGNNQRLEFLGDAVLDLLIADALYKLLPDKDEGTMDRARASLVNGQTLAAMARELDLGKRIQVSESQRNHHPEPSASMLEDVLEALIGAIYLDGGLEAARGVVMGIYAERFETIRTESDQRNPKSRLQEWTQKHRAGSVPQYDMVRAEGPDHKRSYVASVSLDGQEIGRGEGTSIKAAEMAAAEVALKQVDPDG